jgi:hypothetical protein
MKNCHPKGFLLIVLGFLSATALAAGCSATKVVPNPMVSHVHKVAVMPFVDMVAIYGENASIRNSISGKVFITGTVAQNASQELTDQLIAMLENRFSYELISPGQMMGVRSELIAQSSIEIPEIRLITSAGKKLGADTVLIGHIYNYRERAGSPYAIESPASVTFDLMMIDTANERLIWSDEFQETQRSLGENLLLLGKFIRRKGRWISAAEMASGGLKEMLDRLHRLQTAQEEAPKR